MKTNSEKYFSNEIERARERNRVAAKKRRLKEKIMESSKNNDFDQIFQLNQQLRNKIEFLSQVKNLIQREIDKYHMLEDRNMLNLLNENNFQLDNLSIDIIDDILANES